MSPLIKPSEQNYLSVKVVVVKLLTNVNINI